MKKENKRSNGIVGIGASAGGLEALIGLFSNIPDGLDISFIVVQHLDPNRKSMMDSLLARHTSYSIKTAEDGMPVERRTIYLNPPDRLLSIESGRLHLAVYNDKQNCNRPIDHFFCSLASDQASSAVCVILSGTGNDGASGVKVVKINGGIIMVQEPEQAKFDGMPMSAIDTGLVDFVLPVEDLATKISDIIDHPYIRKEAASSFKDSFSQENLQDIFHSIQVATGHDFSKYKPNTIHRRIERRMALHQIETFGDYIRYFKQDKQETLALFRDLLISVTCFFRDNEQFETLSTSILPGLLESKESGSQIRVWVSGCATGEEAYSLAIIFNEIIRERNPGLKAVIFATDIDDNAISFARRAIYNENILPDIGEERMNRCFERVEGGFKINKEIREMVVFATHNIFKDPPFSNLDMISCRNLLIYLNSELQQKILPLFHQSLKRNGILFLGSSESIGTFQNLFTPVEIKMKIFRKRDYETDYMKKILFEKPDEMPGAMNRSIKKRAKAIIGAKEIAEKMIINNFSHPGVLINEDLEILFFSGETGRFLSPAPGDPSLNLINMVSMDIRFKLKAAITNSLSKNSQQIIESVRFDRFGNETIADIEINTATDTINNQKLVMVNFIASPINKGRAKPTTGNASKKATSSNEVMALQEELSGMKEYLQSVTEEFETSNEELKSTNEELQSTNEELQSTNEELETSREELQSTNEELITVNSELQMKIDELVVANNDINNLLTSTDIGTIFLDTKLNIRRFTPAITRLFSLIPTDVGRPVSDITSRLLDYSLKEDSEKVLMSLERIEREIRTIDEKWYTIRILPYRTLDNIIDGVVLTFQDITELKQVKRIKLLASVANEADDAIIVQDTKGKIIAWNKGAEKLYGYSEKEIIEMDYSMLVPDSCKATTESILNKLRMGHRQNPHKTQRITKKGKLIDVYIKLTRSTDESGKTTLIGTSEVVI